jgi:hypothetical protein
MMGTGIGNMDCGAGSMMRTWIVIVGANWEHGL